MSNFKVGSFEVSVGGPYPVFVTIGRGDQVIHNIRHDELADLAYAVDRAMRDARCLLKHEASEV